MLAGWWAGAIAFVCVLLLTPVVVALSRRWKLYDPLGPLKIHHPAISRLGGVSIASGIALAIIAGLLLASVRVSSWWLAAFGLIWLAGLIDDVRGLSPFLKLAGQIGAGVILWSGGWRLPGQFSALAGISMVCAVVILCVNAFNFLDGSDGLAAGVTAIIGVAYVAAPGGASSFGSLVAWALTGATLGFLFSNFPPAKIFMGDSGSTVLGFSVAFLSIDFLGHAQIQPMAVRLVFPLLVAGLPVADGIVVVLRRVFRGVSPLHGDRFHFYDRWLKNGWSPRVVAGTSYAISALLAVAGLLLVGREIAAMVIFAAVPVIAIFVVGLKRAHAGGSLGRAIREHAEG